MHRTTMRERASSFDVLPVRVSGRAASTALVTRDPLDAARSGARDVVQAGSIPAWGFGVQRQRRQNGVIASEAKDLDPLEGSYWWRRDSSSVGMTTCGSAATNGMTRWGRVRRRSSR